MFKTPSEVGLCILYFVANIQYLVIRMIKLIIDVFILFYLRYQNQFYDTLCLFINCYLLRIFVFLTNTQNFPWLFLLFLYFLHGLLIYLLFYRHLVLILC